MTNQEKLEELKKFLQENGLKFFDNYNSRTFGIRMNLKVRKLRIAVFFSDGDPQKEKAIMHTSRRPNSAHLVVAYNPFFIRDNESAEDVVEKMRNCIVNRMIKLQKIWERQQKKKSK
jgi:signal recognition particle receptor subunit beta